MLPYSVLEIPTGPPVRGRQLCSRTGNFLLIFLQFYVYDLRFNTLRPRQNGRHFADDIFKCIFLIENVKISIKISLKFVPKDPINNIPALVQIMAWRRPGDKPLSEPKMVSLLTHINVTRPQWVKAWGPTTFWLNFKHCTYIWYQMLQVKVIHKENSQIL